MHPTCVLSVAAALVPLVASVPVSPPYSPQSLRLLEARGKFHEQKRNVECPPVADESDPVKREKLYQSCLFKRVETAIDEPAIYGPGVFRAAAEEAQKRNIECPPAAVEADPVKRERLYQSCLFKRAETATNEPDIYGPGVFRAATKREATATKEPEIYGPGVFRAATKEKRSDTVLEERQPEQLYRPDLNHRDVQVREAEELYTPTILTLDTENKEAPDNCSGGSHGTDPQIQPTGSHGICKRRAPQVYSPSLNRVNEREAPQVYKPLSDFVEKRTAAAEELYRPDLNHRDTQ